MKGVRAGQVMGFPRFRRKARPQSVRFTTGAIRVEDDRHHLILPVIGRMRTHESTRKLARRIENGTARILSATVKRDSRGRWHVSFACEVVRRVGRQARADHAKRLGRRLGIDVGVRALVVAADEHGREVYRAPAPRALLDAQAKLRRLQRKAARQTRGSNRRAKTMRQIGRLHGRVAAIRLDAISKATTAIAQGCDIVVVEDLNVAGMGARKPGAGKAGRGFNRSIRDAAFGELARQIGYKADWYGTELMVADRWFASSKTCSSCGVRRPSLRLGERTYRCTQPDCGLVIDRDLNAAVNLARWPDQAGVPSPGSGPVEANYGRRADRETDPAQAGDAGGNDPSTPHRSRPGQTGTAARQRAAA